MKLMAIHFYRFDPRFIHPIKTAKIKLTHRRTLFVALQDEHGKLWFGECNAFETDWYHHETIADVQHTLQKWFDNVKGQEIRNFSESQKLVSTLDAFPTARATIIMALYPMFYPLECFSIPMTITINGDFNQRLMKLDQAGRIKVKWNTDILSQVKMLTTMYPMIPISTDANQTLTQKDEATLKQLKSYQLAYIEEPFQSLDVNIDDQSLPPIAIDEHATSEEAIMEWIQSKAVRIVVLKPFRLGGIDRVLSIIERLKKEEVQFVLGGMYECGLSRYYTALLSREGNYAGDIPEEGFYFNEDIVKGSGTLKNGRLYFKPPEVNQSLLLAW
ncbi:o-succinylbenzoate synthase [Staphylococcus coagulans]|uniref:o-succinylbenzoate synthase n=1 Tax=Staphylococcus coagulans TaxID=74706 RepID=UPI00336522D2